MPVSSLKKITPAIISTLNDIRSTGMDAIIAGGAIRDLYHDKPISDIDIFIHSPQHGGRVNKSVPEFNPTKSKSVAAAFEHICKLDGSYDNCVDTEATIGDMLTPNTITAPTSAIHCPAVISVHDMWKGDYLFQLIFVNVPTTEMVANHFNIQLCMCSFDGAKFSLTTEFLEDSNNQTITIMDSKLNELELKATTNHHIPKLLKKYPMFKVKHTKQPIIM